MSKTGDVTVRYAIPNMVDVTVPSGRWDFSDPILSSHGLAITHYDVTKSRNGTTLKIEVSVSGIDHNDFMRYLEDYKEYTHKDSRRTQTRKSILKVIDEAKQNIRGMMIPSLMVNIVIRANSSGDPQSVQKQAPYRGPISCEFAAMMLNVLPYHSSNAPKDMRVYIAGRDAQSRFTDTLPQSKAEVATDNDEYIHIICGNHPDDYSLVCSKKVAELLYGEYDEKCQAEPQQKVPKEREPSPEWREVLDFSLEF